MGRAPGVSSWLAQASWRCRPPPSKRKTYFFPLSFVFRSHKRPGAWRGRPLLSRLAAREALVPNGPGRAGAGAAKKQTSHGFAGSSRAFLACSRLAISPSSCAHWGSESARLPRRAAPLRQADWGWRWEARLRKEKKKAFQPSLLVRKPEGMRNASVWRPNVSDQTA